MAGYLFSIGENSSVDDVVGQGTYSTLMSCDWTNTTEATLGDYITMSPGDNVYFFKKRNIYGIGEIVEPRPGITVFEDRAGATSGQSCVLTPAEKQSGPKNSAVNKPKIYRWRIIFRGSPVFFRDPIDMDDLLATDHESFKSLRTFWKRSFIKLDDEENKAFKRALLRKNLDVIKSEKLDLELPCPNKALANEARWRGFKAPDIKAASLARRNKNGSSKSEMMLEVSILSQLANNDKATEKVFGHWDYLSHQVAASPMKPVDYMDRIDIFGYSWLQGYEQEVIDGYLVAELKKDYVGAEEVLQVMKYVDWICQEYASGDYNLIKAFLVGFEIDADSIRPHKRDFERNFLTQRPPINHVWDSLGFAEYRINDDGYVEFTIITI